MKKKHLKLNIMSLFFVAVSLLSITLAWFAYSGIANTATEVDVKAWYIEFSKNNETVSNEVVLSLNDIYPGMETVTEKIDVKNLGDTDAKIDYTIESARILDEELKTSDNSTGQVLDKLSHDYPFHVNISLNKDFVKAHDDTSEFEVSVSWPLDSLDNSKDSEWGSKAYQFQESEEKKHQDDSNYQVRTSLKIVISIKAEQYVLDNEAPDMDYYLGKLILYDVEKNAPCDSISSTCLKTYVIDDNNKVGDVNVSLLPDLFQSYSVGSYNDYNGLLSSITDKINVSTRALTVEDVVNIISRDIDSSYLVRDGISDVIIGNLKYNDRFTQELNLLTSGNGYYRFSNQKFPYLSTSKCYWINKDYNTDRAFALVKVDDNNSKVYGELKTAECSVVPVLEVSKAKLEG